MRKYIVISADGKGKKHIYNDDTGRPLCRVTEPARAQFVASFSNNNLCSRCLSIDMKLRDGNMKRVIA